MIRITRSNPGPWSLKRFGNRQTVRDCTEYDATPNDYQSGARKFPIKDYYGSPKVKELLVNVHHSKCCYCETTLPREYLHVEHFRPKAGVRQNLNQGKDELPGYYWLAYHWDNLLLACLACNVTNKKTFFPLSNPLQRARCHHDNVANEQALFVDPAAQDPRLHIRFEGDAPKGLTTQGKKTIAGIGLRRPLLREARLEKIGEIDMRLTILGLAERYPQDADLQVKANEARRFIMSATRPESKFSAMAIDHLSTLGL